LCHLRIPLQPGLTAEGSSSCRRRSLIPLQQQSDALPAGDTEGRDAALRVPMLQLPSQGQDNPRAGAADGMSDGDAAAVDIETVMRDVEVFRTGQHLAGKRLVEL